jgi:hypothetical protein
MGENWKVEPVRYRQQNRVQEDFGDGQIACAMMTMVCGSEPSPEKSGFRKLAPPSSAGRVPNSMPVGPIDSTIELTDEPCHRDPFGKSDG